MAIGIANKPNTNPADADYPNGDVKDNPSGTPVNRLVYGDFHQFFEKLMLDSGLVANNQRDNVSNGYQYIEALYKAGKPYNLYSATLSQTGTNDPVEESVMQNELSGGLTLSRSGVGSYAASLVGEFDVDKTLVFVQTSTLNRVVKFSRFDDDSFIITNTDLSGASIDGFFCYVQIFVYR